MGAEGKQQAGTIEWFDLTVADAEGVRDSNADLPPQWLLYITVDDLDASIARPR